ncbi:MAG: hypothetical protein ACTHLT_05780 [Devosia sp.]
MRKLPLLLILLAAPLGLPTLMAAPVQAAAAKTELGDLSALRAIAADTLKITMTGDLGAAERRVSDFESAWDAAAGAMQPKSPTEWAAIDHASDAAIGALRASQPREADAEAALNSLIATLDDPRSVAAAPIAHGAPQAFAVTNADGSPLPCEVALKTLRDAASGKTPTDQAGFDTLMNKGLERCNSDDDKRADGFFANAFALL